MENEQIDIFAHQVRRMNHMRDYPTGNDEELLRVAREYAPCGFCALAFHHHNPEADCRVFKTDHLSDAISQLIEECIRVPSAAELKAALLSRRKDQEPEWRRAAAPQAPANFSSYMEQNEAIMVRARAKEKENAEKDLKVKNLLGIHNFMVVDWPQRFWAERELGYQITPLQNREIDEWLKSIGDADPKIVVGPQMTSTGGAKNRAELSGMFGGGK